MFNNTPTRLITSALIGVSMMFTMTACSSQNPTPNVTIHQDTILSPESEVAQVYENFTAAIITVDVDKATDLIESSNGIMSEDNRNDTKISEAVTQYEEAFPDILGSMYTGDMTSEDILLSYAHLLLTGIMSAVSAKDVEIDLPTTAVTINDNEATADLTKFTLVVNGDTSENTTQTYANFIKIDGKWFLNLEAGTAEPVVPSDEPVTAPTAASNTEDE